MTTRPKLVKFFDSTGSEVYDTYMDVIPRKGETVNVRRGDAQPCNLLLSGKVSFVGHNIFDDGSNTRHIVHVYLEPAS